MNLIQLSQSYADYLNKVGLTDPGLIHEPHFSVIWAKNCKKIMNGTVLYKEGRFFLEQLREARKLAGKWHLDLKETLGDTQGAMSALRYAIKSENLGSFQVCVFLTFNEQGLLTEINEVCCKTE